jgi:hypothetical protein
VPVSSWSLLIRGNLRRLQAENPLIPLSRFPGPALFEVSRRCDHLGIDNLIFITILAGRLLADRQNRARQLGLALALITRLALLGSIARIVGLTQPLFEVLGHTVSWRDLILMGGGFFLLYKGTCEIHHRLEGDVPDEEATPVRTGFGGVIKPSCSRSIA